MESDERNNNRTDSTLNSSDTKSGEPELRNQSEPSPVKTRSTGPRTEAGKNRSKQNSLKHGILSKSVVLKGESQAEFCALLNGFRENFKPKGMFEDYLVEFLATTAWRCRRLLQAEAAENPLDPALVDPALIDIRSYEEKYRRSEYLLRYGASLERSFDRTLNQLERAQRMRLGQPVPPPLNVNISPL
jgi:hypothetical protein